MDRKSYVQALENERDICEQMDKPAARLAAIDAELDRVAPLPKGARREQAAPAAAE